MTLAAFSSLTVVLGVAVAIFASPVLAQDPKKAPAPPQAQAPAQPQAQPPAAGGKAGTAGAGWSVAATGDAATVLEPRQLEAVTKVSAYFNALTNLKGVFVQTNAENKRQRGRFYVKRPGRFRFDYAAPSKQVIISDGHILAIQDHDLGNEDATELDNTPFRLLLRKDVDLVRDARIIDAVEDGEQIVLTLRDKSPDAPGQIRLTLVKKPSLELKEWITTDAQGLDTKVEIGDHNRTEDIDAKLFARGSMALRKIQ